MQLIVKPELFEVEEEVEIEIKASPNSIVYLFATATPPIFQDAEQEKENQIVIFILFVFKLGFISFNKK